jgi:hypothetical protein
VRPRGSVPWWGVVSATSAPVLLIGGWSVAAALQPNGFDPVRMTISALAGRGATDSWVMAAALTGVGACHLATAAALRPAALPGRLMLAVGGAATLTVAALPLPATGTRGTHTAAASVAFAALSLWPALATRWRHGDPRVLSPSVTVPATVGLGTATLWLASQGPLLGLAERVAAGGQAIWPLVTVIALSHLSASQQQR